MNSMFTRLFILGNQWKVCKCSFISKTLHFLNDIRVQQLKNHLVQSSNRKSKSEFSSHEDTCMTENKCLLEISPNSSFYSFYTLKDRLKYIAIIVILISSTYDTWLKNTVYYIRRILCHEGNVLHGCEMFNGMFQHDSYIYNFPCTFCFAWQVCKSCLRHSPSDRKQYCPSVYRHCIDEFINSRCGFILQDWKFRSILNLHEVSWEEPSTLQVRA